MLYHEHQLPPKGNITTCLIHMFAAP